MKKRLSLILVFLAILSCLLFSSNSDNYLLGTYSYFNAYHSDLLYQYVADANYNNHVCGFSSLAQTTQVYNKSSNNNLDVIAIDSSWDPDNNRYGSYRLSKANNYRYEAEYSTEGQMFGEENQGNNIPDMFYYRFNRDIENGSSVEDLYYASNYRAWKCSEVDNNDPGDMCGYLYWKWRDENNHNRLLQREFGWDKQEYFYFDVAIKFDDLGNNANDFVFEFDAYAFDAATQTKISLNPVSRDPGSYGTLLTVEDINNYDPGNTQYKIFTYKVDTSTIDPQIIYIGNNHKRLTNLQFSVDWFGCGEILLDYIRVYDDIYEKLDNGDYDQSLIAEMDAIQNSNLSHLYPKDEPKQANFDSYKIIEDLLVY